MEWIIVVRFLCQISWKYVNQFWINREGGIPGSQV